MKAEKDTILNQEQVEKTVDPEASDNTIQKDTANKNEAADGQTIRHHRRFRRATDNSAETIQQLGQKIAELNDKYMRTVAEFENYRKRTAREKADLILNGGQDVMKAVLPVVDDLERALQAMTDDNAREGVTMIYKKMVNNLSQKGLKVMEAKGSRFDESLHEAVTQIPASEANAKGTVVDVIENGYFLNDKVLRYAKVVVAV